MSEPRRPTRPRLAAPPCRGTLAWIGLLLLAGCGGDGGTTPTDPGPDPAPTTGSLEVSAATTGDTLDLDGYTVTLDGAGERALAVDGAVSFEDVAEGDHEVTLEGVQRNCSLSGETTRTVSVTAGETADVAFDVACVPALLGRIVFDSDRTGDFEIFVMNADGSSPTRVRSEPGTDEADASVSPDGTRVLYRSDRNGAFDIFSMAADGSDDRNLTDHPAEDFDPVWSPDGGRIAFSSDRADGNLDIYVMNADGSGVTRVTEDTATDVNPAWSPDGSRIAFTSHRGGGPGNLWLVEPDGTGLAQVTDTAASDDAPAWTPDGERLVFQSERDGSPHIWVINADGTGLIRVTGDEGPNYFPAVSPGGDRVAFATARDLQFEIYSIGTEGSGPLVNLTVNGDRDFRPAWTPPRSRR